MAPNRRYPPSVQSGIPRLHGCPSGWSTHRFGDLLRIVERPTTLASEAEYQLVIAKRNRVGVVARAKAVGRSIKTRPQYTVEAGDFLISRRQIVHGGCGVVPESLAGAIVSSEYACLQPT